MAVAVYVALLRSVNVGGTGKLPMKDLAAIFSSAGCSEVETYIQSGNVVFAAPDKVIAALPAIIGAGLRKRFAIDSPILIRRDDELRRVIEDNPFLARGVDAGELHVMFLGAAPASGAAQALDPRRSPPDEFIVQGKEIYLRLPNGVARSKLTNAYFEKALKAPATARNWRTVLKLDELTRQKA